MYELLLIVMGCYVMAAVLVHLVYWIGRGRRRVSQHYVWIAGQEQKNMEWHLRSLFSFSRWMGKEVRLTVVDQGATDETMAIVERWSNNSGGNSIHVHKIMTKLESSQKAGKRLLTGAVAGNSDSEGEIYGAGHDDDGYAEGNAVHVQATQLLWVLQAEGIVSESDHAVLVDLENPADLSKMPF